jgi:bacterioferritin-associated ferredoxin
MNLDDDICCCYHVSLRKLLNFARRVRPAQPSRMSECLGAGTGCGWCIPILCRIAAAPDTYAGQDLPETAEKYAENRAAYRTNPDARNRFSDNP